MEQLSRALMNDVHTLRKTCRPPWSFWKRKYALRADSVQPAYAEQRLLVLEPHFNLTKLKKESAPSVSVAKHTLTYRSSINIDRQMVDRQTDTY